MIVLRRPQAPHIGPGGESLRSRAPSRTKQTVAQAYPEPTPVSYTKCSAARRGRDAQLHFLAPAGRLWSSLRSVRPGAKKEGELGWGWRS